MPVKIAGSDCSTIVRAARAAGSHPHLASVLQWHLDAILLGRNSANTCVGLGVIRGIPVIRHVCPAWIYRQIAHECLARGLPLPCSPLPPMDAHNAETEPNEQDGEDI